MDNSTITVSKIEDITMPKAMIISVGGTLEPIIKSINEYKPEFISFFASQGTVDNISKIKTEIDYQFESEITIVDDANNLMHCHEKAEEAVDRVIKRGYGGESVVVDYTGGTKNMSVALSLAAIVNSFMFSYVGGTKRTKDGKGIVIDGCEQVYHSINPWDFLAVEEKKRVSILFNSYQYRAARDYINTITDKTTKFRPLFKQIGFIIDGFYAWDLFKHGEAKDLFKRAKVEDLLVNDDGEVRNFAREVEQLIKDLNNIIEKSNSGKMPCKELILDLFANAQRRDEEGKIDDAILRLYRLVEMLAQERLLKGHGIDTSDVKEEQLPEDLKAEYIRQYKKGQRIKIPQMASFILLKALGDPLGHTFFENEKEFKAIQTSRNESYLAHGYNSAKAATYQKLKEFIVELKVFESGEVHHFPKLYFYGRKRGSLQGIWKDSQIDENLMREARESLFNYEGEKQTD